MRSPIHVFIHSSHIKALFIRIEPIRLIRLILFRRLSLSKHYIAQWQFTRCRRGTLNSILFLN